MQQVITCLSITKVGFTATETIRSKLAFEREAESAGVKVTGYNTDNGVYNAKDFIFELTNKSQTQRISGVGYHQKIK